MKFIITIKEVDDNFSVSTRIKGTPGSKFQYLIARMLQGVVDSLLGKDESAKAKIVDAISDTHPAKPLATIFSKILHTPVEELNVELAKAVNTVIEKDIMAMARETESRIGESNESDK